MENRNENKNDKQKNGNQIFESHTPNYITFPLAEEDYKEKDSKQSIPSEEGVLEVKEWVDYKEM